MYAARYLDMGQNCWSAQHKAIRAASFDFNIIIRVCYKLNGNTMVFCMIYAVFREIKYKIEEKCKKLKKVVDKETKM